MLKAKTAALAASIIGGLALAAAPAHAASLPSCANSINCTNNTASGEAGYYGSDDNHTHYRFTETTITASASLRDLNGSTSAANTEGAVGTELCDPNTGYVAQIGLFWDVTTSSYQVAYSNGTFSSLTAKDPCIDDGFQNASIESAATLLGNFTISQGDKVYVGVYYSPGRHHYLEFGACDITQDVCRQAQVTGVPSVAFWEFGTGALTNNSTLTAPAANLLGAFTNDEVTIYSGKAPIPVSDVTGYNGLGGLTEAQFDNASSQVVMSPDDSLSGSTFSLFEGSTSA